MWCLSSPILYWLKMKPTYSFALRIHWLLSSLWFLLLQLIRWLVLRRIPLTKKCSECLKFFGGRPIRSFSFTWYLLFHCFLSISLSLSLLINTEFRSFHLNLNLGYGFLFIAIFVWLIEFLFFYVAAAFMEFG